MIIFFFKKLRYKGLLGFYFALTLQKLYIFFNYRLHSDEHYIKKSFSKTFGRELNLVKPQTLNEKIQWLKLYYKNPLMVQCADKYSVRSYVAKTIGEEYLIPLLFHTDNSKEIVPENLPDVPFIIKANHTAGTSHIIKDKTIVDWRKVQFDCKWWLHLNYSFLQNEWQYGLISPRIVVEKLLTNDLGEIPSDYKLHYIDGNFEFLQLDLGRFSSHKRLYFDKDWNVLPFTWRKEIEGYAIWDKSIIVEKPKYFNLMISLGAKLSKYFPYVRVDFYYLNDTIYFGEMTFQHAGGSEYFTPNEWDYHYGNKVPLKKYKS
jgi:hypothetical protein